jgi:hypothetical protein
LQACHSYAGRRAAIPFFFDASAAPKWLLRGYSARHTSEMGSAFVLSPSAAIPMASVMVRNTE